MTSLNRDIVKSTRGFCLIFFLVDVKLLLGKVLKISRRCLRPFLSYRENPAVSAKSAPPPPEWDAGYCPHPGAKRHFYKYFNCN